MSQSHLKYGSHKIADTDCLFGSSDDEDEFHSVIIYGAKLYRSIGNGKLYHILPNKDVGEEVDEMEIIKKRVKIVEDLYKDTLDLYKDIKRDYDTRGEKLRKLLEKEKETDILKKKIKGLEMEIDYRVDMMNNSVHKDDLYDSPITLGNDNIVIPDLEGEEFIDIGAEEEYYKHQENIKKLKSISNKMNELKEENKKLREDKNLAMTKLSYIYECLFVGHPTDKYVSNDDEILKKLKTSMDGFNTKGSRIHKTYKELEVRYGAISDAHAEYVSKFESFNPDFTIGMYQLFKEQYIDEINKIIEN